MKERSNLKSYLLGPLIIFSFLSCAEVTEHKPGLKDAYKEYFYIGAALNTSQYKGEDERAKPILETHFNSITPENDMKWENIHPEPDRFFFDNADQYVAFGEEKGMFIIAHALIWHQQTPNWVFEHEDGTPLTRDELLARMENHIKTIVGRYKGRIHGWDVVNEALNDDGTMRESPWYTIIGEDYVEKAFQFAHEADPDAELYYNDYNLPDPEKADGAIRLVKSIQEKGIKVSGIGMQGHYGFDYPTMEALETSILKFSELGVVAITELDIEVLPLAFEYMGADLNVRVDLADSLNPFTEGLPPEVEQQQLDTYKAMFEVFLKHSDKINRVTTWGVTDGDSWKNYWPIPGRTNYPLLFDRAGNEKRVVEELIRLAEEKK
ncbi:MAG: endo-1,4-beta-xylanase [Balneolales bacterium]|nr:endo-1,4-beta-xylanase [Balneolales bacterium]